MYQEEYENNEMLANDELDNENQEEEQVLEENVSDNEEIESEDNEEQQADNEDSEESEKTYNQEDFNKFASKFKNREKRKRERLQDEYSELMHTITNGMQFDENENLTVSQINEKLLQAFKEQDVEITPYQRQMSREDQEILANTHADEVLKGDIEDVAEEYQRLSNKDSLTYGEQIQFNKYQKELALYQASEELEKEGKDPSVLRDQDFIDFASKYKENIDLLEIVDDFTKYTTHKKPTPKPAGSVKGKQKNNKIKEHYSIEEAQAFSTAELLKNPKLLDAINKSSEEW